MRLVASVVCSSLSTFCFVVVVNHALFFSIANCDIGKAPSTSTSKRDNGDCFSRLQQEIPVTTTTTTTTTTKKKK
jgi:hypothetical protein